uniref:F-box domain-containing protein n=1 Tax=Arundo donax TaxID=35708 RepID=A0A0A9CKQ2_ARUDO
MAPRSETAKRQKKVAGVEEDRLSALHEDILLHILSFLPSRELVQKTCLLARSWRNRWKSVPALRVPEDVVFESAHAMKKFVNYLVLLRGPKPLVECEINFWHMDETFGYLDLWIRYALSCKVQVLRIISDVEYDLCPLPDMRLVSDKLTTVELCRVGPEEPLLDFSGCSALQNLTMSYSTLGVKNIVSFSQEAKHMLLYFL